MSICLLLFRDAVKKSHAVEHFVLEQEEKFQFLHIIPMSF